MGKGRKKPALAGSYANWHGDQVILTKRQYRNHVLKNHPNFFGELDRLADAIADPDNVVKKKHGDDAYWVNKIVDHNGRRFCLRVCIVKVPGQLEVKTAFLAETPRRGVEVWRRKK